MRLNFDFGGWGFGMGASIFCIGVLGNGIFSSPFCPEIGEQCYIGHTRFNVLADEKKYWRFHNKSPSFDYHHRYTDLHLDLDS